MVLSGRIEVENMLVAQQRKMSKARKKPRSEMDTRNPAILAITVP